MIKKEELLKVLKQCLDGEEKGMPIYTKHLDNTLFLSDFKKEDQDKLKEILRTLKKESEGHEHTYKKLIQAVKESSRDVY